MITVMSASTSTLPSSSPSPVASPRLSFHLHSLHSSHSQPHRCIPAPITATSPSYAPQRRLSPRPTAQRQLQLHPSPRPTTANPPSPSPSTSTSIAPSDASIAVARPHSSRQRFVVPVSVIGDSVPYVDAGTQYSPDGFPPTAGRKVATAAERPPGSSGSARKRKEAAASDSSPEPMSASASASASSAASAHRPGRAPQPPSADPSTPSRTDGGSRARDAPRSAQPQPEIQEARSTHGHSAAPKRSRPDPASQQIMPLKYETCNPKDIGVLIANMLMELIRINDQIPLRDGRLTRFHSRAPPGISVSDYLQRLIQHATLSPPILLSMVYYIDRLCTLYPAFTINSLTVHRFLITAATVAAKGLSDSFWTNPTYARIGGIPVSELATLELEFLQRVHWKIVPKPEVLEDYYTSLVERTDGYVLEEDSSAASVSDSVSEDDMLAKSSDELG